MKIIPESFLQYVWKNRLFNENSLFCEHGKVKVIETGEQNTGSGPDFSNARILINGTIWAGNIEIHTKASDWFRHGHQNDPAYSNVILHVVQDRDCLLERSGGEIVPSIILEFNQSVYEKYTGLVRNHEKIPCGNNLRSLSPLYIYDWISRLMFERLEEKTNLVQELLYENKYDWEQTLYISLGRGFGFNINSLPFEALTRTAPLLILLKYRERPHTINAILFGQAGFLEDLISEDKYYNALQKEYRSIRSSLPPRILNKHTWKFKGSRPASFPPVRISQFASLVTHNYSLFSYFIDNINLSAWWKIFESGTDRYWEEHYLFGKRVKKHNVRMGKEAIHLIIINVIIPVLFKYASFRNKIDLKDKLLAILEELPAENNQIINNWARYGITARNSLESQSLIQLKRKYCDKRRCLECKIGLKVIRED